MNKIRTDEELEQLKKNNNYLIDETWANFKIWLIRITGTLLVFLVAFALTLSAVLLIHYIHLIWGNQQEIKNVIINCFSAFFGGTMTIVMGRFIKVFNEK
ncbi:MAG: hypothetical protein WC748_00205 [Legionellales bacterium]|jgi:hypothetical protein